MVQREVDGPRQQVWKTPSVKGNLRSQHKGTALKQSQDFILNFHTILSQVNTMIFYFFISKHVSLHAAFSISLAMKLKHATCNVLL